MIKSAASKVAWAARATTTVVGLAIMLALVFGAATTALGANGDFFRLGSAKNAATRATTLVGKAADGAALVVDNPSGGLALHLQATEGQAPLCRSTPGRRWPTSTLPGPRRRAPSTARTPPTSPPSRPRLGESWRTGPPGALAARSAPTAAAGRVLLGQLLARRQGGLLLGPLRRGAPKGAGQVEHEKRRLRQPVVVLQDDEPPARLPALRRQDLRGRLQQPVVCDIRRGDGDNVTRGKNGRDVICVGGVDTIQGGDGRDTVRGGPGRDLTRR